MILIQILFYSYFFNLFPRSIDCDRRPPIFRIDLDKPPRERWAEVADTYRDFGLLAMNMTKQYIPKYARPMIYYLAQKISTILEGELAEEMEGVAQYSGLPLSEVVLINLVYDITAFKREGENIPKACASILAQDASGKVLLARNLDYDLQSLLKNTTIIADFQRDSKTIFTAVTFAFNVGILTGQRHGTFAITLNERYNGYWWYNILMAIFTGVRHPVSFAIREVLQNYQSYDEAVHYLGKIKLISPSYLVISGRFSGQGLVLTRDREKTADMWFLEPYRGIWYLVQTNFDHWKKTDPIDKRREKAEQLLNQTGQMPLNPEFLYKVISTPPVYNKYKAAEIFARIRTISYVKKAMLPPGRKSPVKNVAAMSNAPSTSGMGDAAFPFDGVATTTTATITNSTCNMMMDYGASGDCFAVQNSLMPSVSGGDLRSLLSNNVNGVKQLKKKANAAGDAVHSPDVAAANKKKKRYSGQQLAQRLSDEFDFGDTTTSAGRKFRREIKVTDLPYLPLSYVCSKLSLVEREAVSQVSHKFALANRMAWFRRTCFNVKSDVASYINLDENGDQYDNSFDFVALFLLKDKFRRLLQYFEQSANLRSIDFSAPPDEDLRINRWCVTTVINTDLLSKSFSSIVKHKISEINLKNTIATDDVLKICSTSFGPTLKRLTLSIDTLVWQAPLFDQVHGLPPSLKEDLYRKQQKTSAFSRQYFSDICDRVIDYRRMQNQDGKTTDLGNFTRKYRDNLLISNIFLFLYENFSRLRYVRLYD
uniref:Uncharacterized protein n=1 Tax=Romanomermis culicivorax TaxID=13658 RepID=A0A915I904_ROMCU